MVHGIPWLAGLAIMVALTPWQLLVRLARVVAVLLAVHVQAGAALVAAHVKQG